MVVIGRTPMSSTGRPASPYHRRPRDLTLFLATVCSITLLATESFHMIREFSLAGVHRRHRENRHQQDVHQQEAHEITQMSTTEAIRQPRTEIAEPPSISSADVSLVYDDAPIVDIRSNNAPLSNHDVQPRDDVLTGVTVATGGHLAVDALSTVNVTVDPYHRPATSDVILQGPLCVFVPADAEDATHTSELLAAAHAWFDSSTVLFSSLERDKTFGKLMQRQGATMAKLRFGSWRDWHSSRILSSSVLRQRGASKERLHGRGQLSIPLFHWMAQMVKRNDPLVQNCKWFMKCDTDTFLRRELLEREVLNKLDHTQPYQVGVPLHFNTRPYHHTIRNIEFDYNIGGPGYTFSRGLLAAVNMEECVKSMAMDPVLLIHDDVATGYCATYHAGSQRRKYRTLLVDHRLSLSTSSMRFVEHLLALHGNYTESGGRLSLNFLRTCVNRMAAIHPVSPQMMPALVSVVRDSTLPPAGGLGDDCELVVISGLPPIVGTSWKLRPETKNMLAHWQLLWAQPRQRMGHIGDMKNWIAALRLQKSLYT